jgi:nucleoid DNA-binding protein
MTKMRKDELTLKLARSAQLTPAEAADRLDDVVHDILKKLRQGKEATMPGLGKLIPAANNTVRFSGVRETKAPRRGRR